jgi:hypothetical protein
MHRERRLSNGRAKRMQAVTPTPAPLRCARREIFTALIKSRATSERARLAGWEMTRSILWGMTIALTLASPLHAQDLTELNDLKAKIWEAELAQRNFAAGLPYCSELNSTNFYFYPRDRVLSLQDYRRSLDNFVTQGAFNPETRRPWNKQDAEARWAQVQKQAATDQANCAAVASLPSLRLKLKELQQQQ